ncbi:MAG TPA: cysteine--tRNA ligase [Candidatus Thermoplasmatota archaeon]
MGQRLFNTRAGKLEAFQPVGGNRVTMYVCGPTVYDLAHVGHGRSYVVFDVLRRHLTSLGVDVRLQMNFSDIDEKITLKAAGEGRDPFAVAEAYIAEFLADMDALKVRRADIYTRASGAVPEIVEVVRQLVAGGFAYAVGGFVYFDHRKSKVFGKLTHQRIEDMLAAEVSDPTSRKRSLLDFAVWQEPKPGDPTWDSPWGRGKPGWHLECYVMSRDALGHPLDIKGGGRDLVYPHHESEWAVCEAVSRKPYARFFVHNGFVSFEGTKMSKSMANFVTIREVLARFAPGAVRLWLLSAPYRETLAWDEATVVAANRRYEALVRANARLAAWEEGLEGDVSPVMDPGKVPRASLREIEGFAARYRRAMEADLDTAGAIGALEGVLVKGSELAGDRSIDAEVRKVVAHVALSTARPMNDVLQILD